MMSSQLCPTCGLQNVIDCSSGSAAADMEQAAECRDAVNCILVVQELLPQAHVHQAACRIDAQRTAQTAVTDLCWLSFLLRLECNPLIMHKLCSCCRICMSCFAR